MLARLNHPKCTLVDASWKLQIENTIMFANEEKQKRDMIRTVTVLFIITNKEQRWDMHQIVHFGS